MMFLAIMFAVMLRGAQASGSGAANASSYSSHRSRAASANSASSHASAGSAGKESSQSRSLNNPAPVDLTRSPRLGSRSEWLRGKRISVSSHPSPPPRVKGTDPNIKLEQFNIYFVDKKFKGSDHIAYKPRNMEPHPLKKQRDVPEDTHLLKLQKRGFPIVWSINNYQELTLLLSIAEKGGDKRKWETRKLFIDAINEMNTNRHEDAIVCPCCFQVVYLGFDVSKVTGEMTLTQYAKQSPRESFVSFFDSREGHQPYGFENTAVLRLKELRGLYKLAVGIKGRLGLQAKKSDRYYANEKQIKDQIVRNIRMWNLSRDRARQTDKKLPHIKYTIIRDTRSQKFGLSFNVRFVAVAPDGRRRRRLVVMERLLEEIHASMMN